MTDFITSTVGSIGYIDSGHGHKYGLSEIALKNHDGYYVTSKEANIGAAATSAVETGAFPSSHLADFSSVNLYATSLAKTRTRSPCSRTCTCFRICHI